MLHSTLDQGEQSAHVRAASAPQCRYGVEESFIEHFRDSFEVETGEERERQMAAPDGVFAPRNRAAAYVSAPELVWVIASAGWGKTPTGSTGAILTAHSQDEACAMFLSVVKEQGASCWVRLFVMSEDDLAASPRDFLRLDAFKIRAYASGS